METLKCSVFRYARSSEEERLKFAVIVDGIGGFEVHFMGKKNHFRNPVVVAYDKSWSTKKFVNAFGFLVYQGGNEGFDEVVMPLVEGYVKEHQGKNISLEACLVKLPTKALFNIKPTRRNEKPYTITVVRDFAREVYRQDRQYGTFLKVSDVIELLGAKDVHTVYVTDAKMIDSVIRREDVF